MQHSANDFTTECKEYINNGYTIFPLNKLTKIPAVKCWQNLEGQKKYSPEDFKDKNIGLLLGTRHEGKYLSVIDIDVYSEKTKFHFDSIVQQLGIEFPVYQHTASGGCHIFIKTDKPFPWSNITVEGGHIELRGNKQYVVLAPSIVTSNKTGETAQYVLNASLDEIKEVPSSLIEKYFGKSEPGKRETKNIKAGSSTIKENSLIMHRNTHKLIIKTYGIIKAYEMLGIRGEECGNYYKACCPVHDDRHPSFSIYYDNGIAYCHTSRASYNIPGLAKAIYGKDYKIQIKNIYGFDVVELETNSHIYSNKSIADNLGIKCENVHYNKYIDDAKFDDKKEDSSFVVDEILTDKNNYTIIAETGSGKTTSMIERGNALGKKIVLVAPTIPITEQLAEKFKGKFKTIAITSNTSSYETYKAITNPNTSLICSTYDSLPKLFGYDQFVASNYILIIDEVHNLVTAQGFRPSTLNELNELSVYFTKVISLTGTPEGAIIPNNSRIIKFKRRIEKAKPKVKLFSYETKGLEHLTKHLIKYYSGGISVVYIDNTNDLETLKEILIAEKHFTEDEISLVTANSKEEEQYQSIILKSKLKPGTKILLTTQVIAEGVNINDLDVRSVYTLNSRNINAVRQMVARFRETDKDALTVYEFLSTNSEEKKMIDFQYSLQDGIETAEYLLNKAKENAERHNLTFNPKRPRFYTSMFTETINNNYYYYDKRIGDYIINKYKIAAEIHNNIQYTLSSNFKLRAEYYREFEGWNVTIEELEEGFIDLKDIKDQIKARDEHRLETVIVLLEKFPKETISAYCQYCDKKFFIENVYHLSDLILNTDMKEFYTANKRILDSSKGKAAIRSYVKFYKIKLPHKMIIQIINLKKEAQNELFAKIISIFSLNVVTSTPQVLVYDKNDGISIKRATITNWILNNILLLKEYNPQDLIESYNKMLVSVGCISETQNKMTNNIKEILNLKRDKRKIEGKTVNFYQVEGLHTPMSILEEAKLPVTVEFISAIKNAAKEWFSNKISYLEKSAKETGEILSPSVTALLPKGVKVPVSIVYKIDKRLTPTAKDEWPFKLKLSA